jgi:hypothetical protein
MHGKGLTWKGAVATVLFALGLIVVLAQPFSSSEVGPIPEHIQGCYRFEDQLIQLGSGSATISPGSGRKVGATLNADNQGLYIVTQPALHLAEDEQVALSFGGGRETLLRIRSDAAEELYAHDRRGRLITMPKVHCGTSVR